MSFTDKDLALSKQYDWITPEYGYRIDVNALILRLEAAEKCLKYFLELDAEDEYGPMLKGSILHQATVVRRKSCGEGT